MRDPTTLSKPIPLNLPALGQREREAAIRALASGSIGGAGEIGRRVERHLAQRFGVRHALLTTSCTHALELAMLALDIGPGDEVILPSFTMTSTATAALRVGATLVFADIDERSWNLDPLSVARCLTGSTRAIVPVHYAGLGTGIDLLLDLARQHGLAVVEDAAHAINARYRGRFLGATGTLGCFSFHVTKNVTSGEGGALLTDDADLGCRADIIREKGTDRQAFLRGEVDLYTWRDVGSSFVLSDLLAAILEVQLERLDEITARRRFLWQRYRQGLLPLEEAGHLLLPMIDSLAELNGHIFAFCTRDPARRDPLLSTLQSRGIGAAFHYIPLHSSPHWRRVCAQQDRPIPHLPVTDRIANSLVRLPLFPDMSETQQDYIIEALEDALLNHIDE